MDPLNIVVAIDGSPDDHHALAIAADLARRHQSPAVVVNTYEPEPYVPAYASVVMQSEIWQDAEQRRSEVGKRLALEVRAQAHCAGLNDPAVGRGTLSIAASDGSAQATLRRELCLADLAVVAGSALGGATPWVGPLASILIDARVPVLVARGDIPSVGRPAAIAWDGSFEAGRAVHGALPLLKAASEIAIVQDVEGLDTSKGASADPERLLGWLEAHSLGADAVSTITDAPTGPALSQMIEQMGVALLVAGAYHRGRLREAMLGGTTRSFLSSKHGHHLLLAH